MISSKTVIFLFIIFFFQQFPDANSIYLHSLKEQFAKIINDLDNKVQEFQQNEEEESEINYKDEEDSETLRKENMELKAAAVLVPLTTTLNYGGNNNTLNITMTSSLLPYLIAAKNATIGEKIKIIFLNLLIRFYNLPRKTKLIVLCIMLILLFLMLICCYRMSKNSASLHSKKKYIVQQVKNLHGVGEKSPFGNLTFSLEFNKKKKILNVGIMYASSLKSVGGRSLDPFVELTCKTEKEKNSDKFQKTKVQKNTNEPVFNEIFPFKISQDLLKKQILTFRVFDWDPVTSPTCVGQKIVNIADLNILDFYGTSTEYEMNLDEAPDIQSGNGNLCVILRYDNTKSLLQVTVLEGQKMSVPTSATKINATIKITVKRREIAFERLEGKGNCRNPYFHQSFTYKIRENMMEKTIIKLNASYSGKWGITHSLGKIVISHNSTWGTAEMQWNEMMNLCGRPVVAWHSLYRR